MSKLIKETNVHKNKTKNNKQTKGPKQQQQQQQTMEFF